MCVVLKRSKFMESGRRRGALRFPADLLWLYLSRSTSISSKVTMTGRVRVPSVSVTTALLVLLQAFVLQHATGFQTSYVKTRQPSIALRAVVEQQQYDDPSSGACSVAVDRKNFLLGLSSAASVIVVGTTGFPSASQAKSYSENAANLERINSGDFSGTKFYVGFEGVLFLLVRNRTLGLTAFFNSIFILQAAPSLTIIPPPRDPRSAAL